MNLLQSGSVVTIGIDLPGRVFAEDQAVVHSVEEGEMLLELCGNLPGHVRIENGTRVVVTGGTGRSQFSARGAVRSRISGRLVRIGLIDGVDVSERRGYARADVLVPVHYQLPAGQEMKSVIDEWQDMSDGLAEHRCTSAACGQSRVNLSASGLRFKIRDYYSYGTLLHVRIALPGRELAPIHAVGAIVRTRELLPEMDRLEYYSTSMSFRMIRNSDRRDLIRHVLEERHRQIDQ